MQCASENGEMKLAGVLPPITTPLDADGELDLDGLCHNVQSWGKTGLRGLVALGSNGEAALLNDDESDRVIATVREHLPDGQVLIAGTARESTSGTVAATCRAADLGADAVLVRTPSFFKSQMVPEVFIRHYLTVADAAPVPVLLYNFTAVTGVNLLPATVARLAEHTNIIGVKESGPDLSQVGELIRVTPDEFHVLVGSAPTFYPSLCLGATGGILALAGVVPELCIKLFKLTTSGRHMEALDLQRRLTPLARLVTSSYGVGGLKAAMDIVGYVGGQPRTPLPQIPPKGLEQIRKELELFTDTEMLHSAVRPSN